MADGRIQTRISERLETWLTGRAGHFHTGSADQQARTELELWNSTLGAELRRIRLTLKQASCVADVCNGWVMGPGIAIGTGQVFAECHDAFQLARSGPGGDISSYGERWGIDEQELLQYLSTLGPAADHALQDAIARWWELDDDATVESFAKVGLRVTDDQPAGEKTQ
jgi:hypothetical protein